MYNSHCYGIHKVSSRLARTRAPRAGHEEGCPKLDWANLPHDYAETLELVFVGITIVATLGILVAFGHWWQR